MINKSKLPRKISNKELADLSHDWVNPKVDTTKMVQSVYPAYEVDKEIYDQHVKAGGLGQVQDNRFYIA